jgi:hypothetical protein
MTRVDALAARLSATSLTPGPTDNLVISVTVLGAEKLRVAL